MNKVKYPFSIIKTLFKFEPRYFLLSFLSVILSPIISFVSVYFPKKFIDNIENTSSFNSIFVLIIIYLVILIALAVFNYLFNFLKEYYSSSLVKKIQLSLANKAIDLDYFQLESNKTRSDIELAKNINQSLNIFSIYVSLLSNILTLISLFSAIVIIQIKLLIIILIVFILRILLNLFKFKAIRKSNQKEASNNKTGQYLDNSLYYKENCAKEIRVNSLHNWFKEKFISFREKMIEIQLSTFKIDFFINCFNNLIFYTQLIIILLILVNEYKNNNISIASFIVYYNALFLAINTLNSFSDSILTLTNNNITISDYFKVIYKSNTLKLNNGKTINSKEIILKFENVSFKYPNSNDYVLKNINVTINNNEKIAIVGLNGAGKSTFIKLICKFYIPSEGKITINNINIWDIDNEEYYKMIACVFQDYSIFAFSIKENIVMNQNDENFDDLLKKVDLYNDILNFPIKENTYISKQFKNDGIELSGGQKQKLVMARALYKNAKILILDEPLSALDIESENKYYKDFMNLKNNGISLFISHRLAICKYVDRILIFNNKTIEGNNTHNYLLKNNELYKEMYSKQVKYYEK